MNKNIKITTTWGWQDIPGLVIVLAIICASIYSLPDLKIAMGVFLVFMIITTLAITRMIYYIVGTTKPFLRIIMLGLYLILFALVYYLTISFIFGMISLSNDAPTSSCAYNFETDYNYKSFHLIEMGLRNLFQVWICSSDDSERNYWWSLWGILIFWLMNFTVFTKIISPRGNKQE